MSLNNHEFHPKRPVVIGGCSGGKLDLCQVEITSIADFSGSVDRPRGLLDLAKIPEIDVITGDWMSEGDMAVNGDTVSQLKQSGADLEKLGQIQQGYHANFLSKIEPALNYLVEYKTKVVCNAGGSNPHGLAETLKQLLAHKGIDLRVSWIEGDDVSGPVLEKVKSGADFRNITTGMSIQDWGFEPLSAQCYLGAAGIARALEDSDIIICGRVADSSPCMGAAIWWHGWTGQDLQELAAALIAGHLIECGSYAVGGCFAGFKKWEGKAVDIGFPIAHIDHQGGIEISKEPGKDGEVSVETITSQLVYEIQGPLYYNSSVTASLENIRAEQIGKDRVRVTGVVGLPPPPSTKCGITARGGYRAEYHIYLAGLDIAQKIELTRAQTITAMGPENYKRFSLLKFQQAGIPDPNARSQDTSTVDVRIFAQTADPDLLKPEKFLNWCKMNILQSAPGLTPITDPRQGSARLYYEYFPTLIGRSMIQERVHLPDGRIVSISPAPVTRPYPATQKSYETTNPLPPGSWGLTTPAPLGYFVLGRSGDKSSDANVGFFVRNDDEWDWLRSTMTVDKLKLLLADDYVGKPIDRFEMPGLRAVHFLLHDHLDKGYNGGSTLDCLGKNLVEYLRAKVVDVPTRFLGRPQV